MSYSVTSHTSVESGAMKRNRRRGEAPIPHNVDKYLNEDQLMSLRQMESFGWELAFIRRPLFQEPVAVVSNSDHTNFGVLELDGSINTKPDIVIRH